jgi:hypothetical protein
MSASKPRQAVIDPARVRRVQTRDGREQVVLDLADFEALVIAAETATAPPLSPELRREIVERLRQNFEADRPGIDLDEFTAAYDAAHPAD